MVAKDKVLVLMESRFDYHSARVVLDDALRIAGLAPTAKTWSPEEIGELAKALAGMNLSRAETMIAALGDLAGSGGKASAKAPAAPEPEVVAEASADAAADTGDSGESKAPPAAPKPAKKK
jgi:hypothetical protein